MASSRNAKKNEPKGKGLIDFVFSWSLADALNRDLYKGKVGQIPTTFSSTYQYLKSFIDPIIEETHADLCSNILNVARAPTREIIAVRKSKDYKPPKELYYKIAMKPSRKFSNGEGMYVPEADDLIALTDRRPKCTYDLNRPPNPYVLALVEKRNNVSDKLTILSSKPIAVDADEAENEKRNKTRFFVVYLTNMTTNIRIWKALNSQLAGGNMNIIERVLSSDSVIGSNCSHCISDQNKSAAVLNAYNVISSFKLDDSQRDAVIECVATRERNDHTVKLIWGPPGTGKTKTVSSLLFALWKMRCRTVTCAPTNIAVLGVAKRLVGSVKDALLYDSYGLGDILLFGNGERMKIDNHEYLFDVFISHRVSCLADCFAPLTGWKSKVESVIVLLEDPERQYCLYLEKAKNPDEGDEEELEDQDEGDEEEKNDGNSDKDEDDICDKDFKDIYRTKIMRSIVQTLQENKKKQNKMPPSGEHRENNEEKEDKSACPWTFEEFILNRFKFIGNDLLCCIKNLYTHLPTSFISEELVKKMIRTVDLLESIGKLLETKGMVNDGLSKFRYEFQDVGNRSILLEELSSQKTECIKILKLLSRTLELPTFTETEFDKIQSFCLKRACLIFCTASSSAKLHVEGQTPVEMLIIDEAAQLKECESTIPLQLPGLHHAVLIGDERQLPAMVQSRICENAEFGRSLFERLVVLGQRKHLLEVQYRMHPSISLFPNMEFYNKKILDAPIVKQKAYEKRFLQGKMFGPYSFINVTNGKEGIDNRHSTKNIIEVAVVMEIVAMLFKESVASKQKLSVGCISPYKAQAFALQEKLGKTYDTDSSSGFSVSARSVDGFQGGEEDVIIISTVRCNARGSVGFLSNSQRTNVALTRARHCLWIVGNGATLVNSGSVWERLVQDAKARECFHDASDDKNLALAVAGALLELNQLDVLLKPNSILFCNASWKVCFSDDFIKSMARIHNTEFRKQVLSILEKLSGGWRLNGCSRIVNKNGAVCQIYEVNGFLRIAWSVDIMTENSEDVQVLKIWDVIPFVQIPKLTMRLAAEFENYTAKTINQCKYERLEGNLTLPMTWPVSLSDCISLLESKVASLSVRDKPSSSA